MKTKRLKEELRSVAEEISTKGEESFEKMILAGVNCLHEHRLKPRLLKETPRHRGIAA